MGDDHPAYYAGDKHPGLTATIQGIEQLTGLAIDQYVMLNLRGFADFVDAIGGLNINVTEKLPIGGDSTHHVAPGGWIKPGQQRLNGYHSLWYARSRWSTDDFDRMRRQRCVIGAVVKQANPAAVALGFGDIMKTLSKNFLTSIPLKDLNAWVSLALRVKKAKVTSLTFTSSIIDTTRPNVTKMHDLVNAAINPAPKSTTTPTPSTSSSPTKKKKAKKTITSPTTTDAGQAADLAQVC